MQNKFIHPSAVIEPGANIAKDVRIGPFSYIGSEVTLESGVQIKSHAVVTGKTKIGQETVIYPFAVVGEIPQDLKFGGEESIARIGDHTTIRECVTVNRGTSTSGETIVGDNCLFMAYSHVAHDCIIEIIVSSQTVWR